jgi:hypothetical protein
VLQSMPANVNSSLLDLHKDYSSSFVLETRLADQDPLCWLSALLSQPEPHWTRSELFVSEAKRVVSTCFRFAGTICELFVDNVAGRELFGQAEDHSWF